MYQFANGYSCAIDNAKSTVLLNFFQKFPVFHNGELEAGEDALIASVVIPTEMAAELSTALHELLNDDATDTVLDQEESKEAEE